MRTKLTAAVVCVLMMATGCTNQDVKLFTGEYTYKTSGNVDITLNGNSFTHTLNNSIGQMDIVDLKQNDSVLIVKNEMSGSVQTLRAQVREDSLFLEPYSKELSVTLNGETTIFDIQISGNGVIYDKNTIIINEVYDGEAQGSVTGSLNGESIKTVAKRN